MHLYACLLHGQLVSTVSILHDGRVRESALPLVPSKLAQILRSHALTACLLQLATYRTLLFRPSNPVHKQVKKTLWPASAGCGLATAPGDRCGARRALLLPARTAYIIL